MPSVALQFPSGRGSGRSFLSQLARDVGALLEELASAIGQARQMAGSRISNSPSAAWPARPSRDLSCSAVGS